MVMALAAFTAGCGSSDKSSDDSGGSAAASTTPAATTEAPKKEVTVGFAWYARSAPVNQVVESGAKAAAKDLGAKLLTGGPTDTADGVAVVNAIKSMVNAGAQGIVAPAPPGVGKELKELQAEDIPVATANSPDTTVDALYVGEAGVTAGKKLAEMGIEALGGPDKAKGEVLVGNCVPGIQSLTQRQDGVLAGLKAAPGLKVVKPFGTDPEPGKNYPIYQQQYRAHPDAVLILGLCSTDTVSIGKLALANDKKFKGAGFDITDETLKAVADGGAYATLGQGSFLQGYLSTRAVIEALQSGKPAPTGFVNSGTEVVTADNVAKYQALGTDAAALTAFYADQEKAPLDPQPMATQGQ